MNTLSKDILEIYKPLKNSRVNSFETYLDGKNQSIYRSWFRKEGFTLCRFNTIKQVFIRVVSGGKLSKNKEIFTL